MHASSHRSRATPLDPDTKKPRPDDARTAKLPSAVSPSHLKDAPRMPARTKPTAEQVSGEMTVDDHEFIESVMAVPALRLSVGKHLSIPQHTLDAMFSAHGKFTVAAFGDQFTTARTSLCLLHRWVAAVNQATHEVPHNPDAEQKPRFRAVVERLTRARGLFGPSFEAFYPAETRPSVTIPDED